MLLNAITRICANNFAYSNFYYRTDRLFASTAQSLKMASKLTESERTEHIKPLENEGWAPVKDRDAITRVFTFKDFNTAFGFMSRVALQAEKEDHHPEWSNVYNTVNITWSTHSAGGLSMNDVRMAKFCDKVYKN